MLLRSIRRPLAAATFRPLCTAPPSSPPPTPAAAALPSQRQTDAIAHAWQQWGRLERFLATGQVCVIDGANGTEIQRCGGKPAETFSSGTAPLERPDLCQEVHEAYLEAGADILISNSYSANRNVMSPSGNGERAVECILAASAIARRATATHAAAHATKLSTEAAAASAGASATMAAAATAAARATTSTSTNAGAAAAAESAVAASTRATEASLLAERAAQTVLVCAAAANAAASASLAASEGMELPAAAPPMQAPDAVPLQGWDAAGFGPTLVVGSLSTHPPEMKAGGMSSAEASWPAPGEEAAAYGEAGVGHALSGVDMLWLEMMKDGEHAPRAVAAAAASGLPVFLGVSARTDRATGQLVLFGTGEDCVPLRREWFDELRDALGASLCGVNVMHTNFSSTAPALDFVRNECGWDGPLGAYPDHGAFEAPEWVFRELDNSVALEHVESWIKDYGVQLVGGCCGLGPEYITAVAGMARRHNATVREASRLYRFPSREISV